MLKKFEHGGNIHQLRRSDEEQDWLDFSANINPQGIPISAMSAIWATLPSIAHYPDPENIALKAAIVNAYQVDAAMITPGNGAVELLYILCHVLKPQTALIPVPSFSEYERAARAVQAKIEFHHLVPANDFEVSLAKLIPLLPMTDILFLGNPNNPTGTLLTAAVLEFLIAAAQRQNCFVVIDESFLDFREDAAQYTCRQLIGRYDNLLILHSLTKFYALPGLRLGFALTNPALTAKLHAAKDPWNVNALAQAAGTAALADTAYRRSSLQFLMAEGQRFCRELQAIPGLKVYPPTVNFVLVDIKGSALQSHELKQRCLTAGILIRDCANYPGLTSDYVRFAIKTSAENDRLLGILKKILSGEEK